MLFRYLPTLLDNLTSKFANRFLINGIEHHFQKWENIYLSNRELSTEFRYCFDRKQEKRFIGNTLDKPRLVLKRTLIKSTHAQEEVVSAGTKYSKIEESPLTQIVNNTFYGATIGCDSSRQERYRRMPPYEHTINLTSTYQNFIGQAPLAKYNLPASVDGTVILELDEEFKQSYGCALILAVEENSTAHYLYPFPGTIETKRDLTLAKALDKEKSYSEMRTATCVSKFNTYIIEDITNANLQIIDSLEKVLLVIKQLMISHNINTKGFDEFMKVIKWETMKEEEKNKMVSRYGSHELHLFIYKKDPEYFGKVLKEHLLNKMEKTLVDYYILGDVDNMLQFTKNPVLIDQLNPLEKALLVEALAKDGKLAIAQAIANRIRNALYLKEKNITEQNRTFDVVLFLGSLKIEQQICERNQALDKLEGTMNSLEESAREMNLPECGAPNKKDVSLDHLVIRKSDDMFEVTKTELQSKDIPKPKEVLEELGETKEYAETNYYENTSAKNWQNVVSESEFWADYADHCLQSNQTAFLSHQFIVTYKGLTEALGAISLLDLPYISSEHGFKLLEGRSAELKAGSNLIIFKKEIKECKEEKKANIIVAQKYIDWEQQDDTGTKIEEFLINHPYIGQVIVTNISSRKLEFDVLVQIPQGALPLMNSSYQKSYPQSLESYKAIKIEYVFYFPNSGQFPHFPANVSIDSVVVAKSNFEVLNVVKKRLKISEENFNDVLSTGNHEMIIKFLKDKPIEKIKGFSWDNLFWLLKDNTFYELLIGVLKEQQRFESIVWSYSIFHKKREDLIAEYLDSLNVFKENCGYYFDSKLLKVRPIDSEMRHLDYYPLVNPRAHKTSATVKQPLILNTNLYRTYKMWILYLMEKPVWSLSDKLNLVYYLLLQDRVAEALNIFTKINPEKEEGTFKLQSDYITVYLDFYNGAPEFKKAREIIPKYINYPITTWRLLFLAMDQQLKEYDGMQTEDFELEERKEMKQKKPIKSESLLNVSLENKEIVIEYENVKEVTMKFYIIDLEVMFSRAPFLTHNTEGFAYVKANSVKNIKLEGGKVLKFAIPEDYKAKDVLIEVSYQEILKYITYFSTALKLQIFENYGELKVLDANGKALSQVYIKAFAMKNNGSVMFYKDGYTDIRGRFDYISLNASQLANVKKFALFIMSDEHGSLIKECLPPAITARPDEDINPRKMRLVDY